VLGGTRHGDARRGDEQQRARDGAGRMQVSDTADRRGDEHQDLLKAKIKRMLKAYGQRPMM
jgi:hypothetical protein